MNREVKTAYFSDKLQASQGDLKETWATINKLVNKRSKTTNITALEVDGQTIDDPVGMANSMNDFFSNICVKLCNDISDTGNDLLNGDYFSFFHFQIFKEDSPSSITIMIYKGPSTHIHTN